MLEAKGQKKQKKKAAAQATHEAQPAAPDTLLTVQEALPNHAVQAMGGAGMVAPEGEHWWRGELSRMLQNPNSPKWF